MPLVPAKFAALAGVAATALAAAAAFAPKLSFLPAWAAFALWALAAVAALLAGVAMPSFSGGPVVPLVAVPTLLSAAGALGTFASTQAPGLLQSVALFLAVVCSALAGKALPQPQSEPIKG